jgi:hypothetical protein
MAAKRPKKKSKELLFAEFFYTRGRRDALSGQLPSADEKEIIESRSAHALKQWKEAELSKPYVHPDDVPLPFLE